MASAISMIDLNKQRFSLVAEAYAKSKQEEEKASVEGIDEIYKRYVDNLKKLTVDYLECADMYEKALEPRLSDLTYRFEVKIWLIARTDYTAEEFRSGIDMSATVLMKPDYEESVTNENGKGFNERVTAAIKKGFESLGEFFKDSDSELPTAVAVSFRLYSATGKDSTSGRMGCWGKRYSFLGCHV